MIKSFYMCDRCGLSFSENQRQEQDLMLKRTSRDKNGNVYTTNRIDLCPGCYDALMRFLYNENSKE